MILDSGNMGGGDNDESLVETKKIVVGSKEIRGEMDMEKLENQTAIKGLVLIRTKCIPSYHLLCKYGLGIHSIPDKLLINFLNIILKVARLVPITFKCKVCRVRGSTKYTSKRLQWSSHRC